MPSITEVFVPNDIPTYTYVSREDQDLEKNLILHVNTPKMIVSLSGPSKAGKTVLLNKVVSQDSRITLNGSGIRSASDLWRNALNAIGLQEELSIVHGYQTQGTISATGGGEVGIPLISKGKASGTASGSLTSSRTKSSQSYGSEYDVFLREFSGNGLSVFIDDFHYMGPSTRTEIGKQIKAAAESGVKFITASVPYRTDDVVRTNPELRGRVAGVDIDYWNLEELLEIGVTGFDTLKFKIKEERLKVLAKNAVGSPQLMQSLCLFLASVIGVENEKHGIKGRKVLNEELERAEILTSTTTDFSTMVKYLHTGPRVRGTDRTIFNFTDGSSGDVYRAVLLAICSEPPQTSFTYDDLVSRTRDVCSGTYPGGSGITRALEQMDDIAKRLQPNSSPISWDGSNLDMTDPYLLFYLRASNKIAELGA